MKIVVADDSRVMRQIVIRTLRQSGHSGHQILEAANGRETVEVVLRELPDLVLSDWNMPEMNGLEALSALRAAGNEVAFGFVTSEGSHEMRRCADRAGAAFLISKPFTPEAFDVALTAVLNGQTPRATEASAVSTPLPTVKAIKEVLGTLLGREVSLSSSIPLTPGSTPSVALVCDDAQQPRAVVACDLALSARAGAALALLPPARAEEAIRSGALDGDLGDNLYEVLNVLASLLNAPGVPHLRIVRLHRAGLPVPVSMAGLMLSLGRREDLRLDIAGYGPGRISIVLCG